MSLTRLHPMLFGPSPFVTGSGDSVGYHGTWARRARPDRTPSPSAWPSTVDALVEWIEAHGNAELPGHDVSLARHARAAATLARRDGACDALIAAAVVHDLPFIEEQPTREAWLPMPWLRTLFDDNVLGPVRLMGEDVAVRAQVHTIGGFSAHADQDDLLAFLSSTGKPHVWLVHGEPGVMDAFVPVLAQQGLKADMVPDRQNVELLGPGFSTGRPPGVVITETPEQGTADAARATSGE